MYPIPTMSFIHTSIVMQCLTGMHSHNRTVHSYKGLWAINSYTELYTVVNIFLLHITREFHSIRLVRRNL